MDLRSLVAQAGALGRLPEVYAEDCLHARLEVATCRRCVDVCPNDAWVLDDDQLAVDASCCDGCGLCAAACTEGALRLDFEPELRFWRDSLTAFVACERTGVGPADGRLPCIHALGMGLLTSLYARGVRRVAWCAADCDACDRGQAAERLPVRMGHLQRVLTLRALPGIESAALAPARWQAARSAAASLAGPRIGRRAFLREILASVPPRPAERFAGRSPGLSLPPAAPDAAALFAPDIDAARCEGCDACVRICRPGALQLASGGDAYLVNAGVCTGCGACVDVCGAGAIRIARAASPARASVPLRQGRCRSCGAAFHRPDVDDRSLCRICLQVNHPRRLFQVL